MKIVTKYRSYAILGQVSNPIRYIKFDNQIPSVPCIDRCKSPKDFEYLVGTIECKRMPSRYVTDQRYISNPHKHILLIYNTCTRVDLPSYAY